MKHEVIERLAKLADEFEAQARWPMERYSERVDAQRKQHNEQAAADIRAAVAELRRD